MPTPSSAGKKPKVTDRRYLRPTEARRLAACVARTPSARASRLVAGPYQLERLGLSRFCVDHWRGAGRLRRRR